LYTIRGDWGVAHSRNPAGQTPTYKAEKRIPGMTNPGREFAFSNLPLIIGGAVFMGFLYDIYMFTK
jgi:hypothetical protein